MSAALTTTPKALPAVRAVGDPDFPVVLPGLAVSPGINNCKRANAPAVTVIAELVFAAITECVTLLAVTVLEPAALSVMLNEAVPPSNGALAGSTAFESLERIRTVSFVLIKFHFASTAFTETANVAPAGCGAGDPIFPDAEPGIADSPGTSICSWTKG